MCVCVGVGGCGCAVCFEKQRRRKVFCAINVWISEYALTPAVIFR